jgi:hypothetical protein
VDGRQPSETNAVDYAAFCGIIDSVDVDCPAGTRSAGDTDERASRVLDGTDQIRKYSRANADQLNNARSTAILKALRLEVSKYVPSLVYDLAGLWDYGGA